MSFSDGGIEQRFCKHRFAEAPKIETDFTLSIKRNVVSTNWVSFQMFMNDDSLGRDINPAHVKTQCLTYTFTYKWKLYPVDKLHFVTEENDIEVKGICKGGFTCKVELRKLKPGTTYLVRWAATSYSPTMFGRKVFNHDTYNTNYYCYFTNNQRKLGLKILEPPPIIKEEGEIVSINTHGFNKEGNLSWTCDLMEGKDCPNLGQLKDPSVQIPDLRKGKYLVCVKWIIERNQVDEKCINFIIKEKKSGPIPPAKPDLRIECKENCPCCTHDVPLKVTTCEREHCPHPSGNITYELTDTNGTIIPIGTVKYPGPVRSVELKINLTKLEPNKPYQLIAKDDSGNNSPPFKIEFKPMEPPKNGTCDVKPTSGMRGVTLFNIECNNWISEGTIIYEFFDKAAEDIDHYQGRMIGYSATGILSQFRLTRGNVVIYILNSNGDGTELKLTVQLQDFDRSITHIEYLIDSIEENLSYGNFDPALDMISTAAEILYEEMNNDYYIRKLIMGVYKVDTFQNVENMKLTLSTILSVLVNGTLKGKYLLDDTLEKYIGKILFRLSVTYLEFAVKPDNVPRLKAAQIHQLSRNFMDCIDMTMIAQDKTVTKLRPEEDVNYNVMQNLIEASKDIGESYMIAMYLVGRFQPYGAPGKEIVSTEGVTDSWTYVYNAENLVDIAGSNMATYVKISNELATTFNENHDIMLQFSSMKRNLFWWQRDDISTEVIVVGLAEKLGRPSIDYAPVFQKPLLIYMKVENMKKETVHGVAIQLDPNIDSETLDKIVLVHRFIVPPLSKLYIRFNFDSSSSPLRVLVSYNERPSWESILHKSKVVNMENPDCIVPYDTVEREHFYYMGILPDETVPINAQTEYTFGVYYVSCYTWENQWSNHYCLVGSNTTEQLVECRCTHLSFFSSSILVPQNDINPVLDAPLFLTVMENPYVVILVICLFLLFLLFLLWAYFKDRKDAQCRDVIVLHDNFPGESYGYLIAVFTGSRFTSGTSADVGLRLYGDTYASRPTVLKSETRRVLQRDNDDWFLLCYPVSLGILNAVQVWHNNAGTNPDWFCSKIIVYDLYAKTQYIFLVDQWLAMEVDEFPEAMVRPATSDEIMSIKRIFLDNSVHGLRENHLQLSIVARHPRSPVCRKQRLIVLMVLIMAAMLTSIMFFKMTDKFGEDSDEYHYNIGNRELLVSFQAFIISAILAFVAMFLFRASYKQKPVHQHRSTLFMQKNRSSVSDKFWLAEKPAYIDHSTFIAYSKRPAKEKKDMSMYDNFVAVIRRCTHQKVLHPVHLASEGSELTVRKGWLIAAWIYSILVIIVCAYLVMLYSLKFGKVKSLKWLSTLMLSQAQDILLFTPMKIMLIAMLLSMAFDRTTDIPSFKLDVQKAITRDKIGDKKYLNDLVNSRKKSMYYPMSNEAKTKKRRKAIRKMKWRIVLDFIAVLMFIFLLCYIMKVLWSGSHYYPNSHAGDIMMTTYHGRFIALKDVYNRTLFFSYLQNTFVRSLFEFRWFSDLEFPLLSPPDSFGRKDWTKDFASRMVGSPRLRQLRIITSYCKLPKRMESYVRECTPPWRNAYMDKDTYGVKWRKEDWSDLLSYEWGHRTQWMYREPKNTSVFPLSGKSDTVYPSGGYILPLTVKRATTKAETISIERESWIDHRTRAIFLELTLYNPNIHLFTQVTAIIEHMTSGFYLTSSNVDSVHNKEDWSAWNVIYINFIVVLFLRIVYKMNRNGLFHFGTKLLNLYEVLVIIIGVLSVFYYIKHLNVSTQYLEEFNREGLDRFFYFKNMIINFLYTKVLLWVLFCLLVFRLFVSWYFGRTYIFFYHTFLLSKRWCIMMLFVLLFYYYITWRFVGYVIDAKVFYNYRVLILSPVSYNYVCRDVLEDRTKIVGLILCYLSLFLKIIFFLFFTHYYKIGKRKALKPMHHLNLFSFICQQVQNTLGMKKEDKIVTERVPLI